MVHCVIPAMVVGSSPDGLNHVGRNHKAMTTGRKYSQRKSQHVGSGWVWTGIKVKMKNMSCHKGKQEVRENSVKGHRLWKGNRRTEEKGKLEEYDKEGRTWQRVRGKFLWQNGREGYKRERKKSSRVVEGKDKAAGLLTSLIKWEKLYGKSYYEGETKSMKHP